MTADDPESWSHRYRTARTPWDLDGAHPELVKRLATDPALGRDTPGTAYVPGCGRGHDAVALARAGWVVTASDFAPALAESVTADLHPYGGAFVLGDSLAIEAGFDLWFDHTFFCAVPPARRAEYGRVARRSVSAGGQLISIVFPLGRPVADGGPPFGMTTEDVDDALGDGFDLVADDPALAAGRRRWAHRWAVWRRR